MELTLKKRKLRFIRDEYFFIIDSREIDVQRKNFERFFLLYVNEIIINDIFYITRPSCKRKNVDIFYNNSLTRFYL